jgi:membrane protease YdiL (CAAX protease family)
MKKTLFRIFIFILLLLGMAIFPYIPLKIFRLSTESFSETGKIIYSFVCDILYMGIIFLIYRKEIISNFKDFFKNFGKNLETCIKYYIIGFLVMVVSNVLIRVLIKDAVAGNEDAVRNLISQYPVYMIFSVSLYAPFIEEMIFRKSIRDMFLANKDNKFLRIIFALVSGLIFGLMHIVGTSDRMIDYVYIIPYFALGFSFALLYNKSNNIFSSICMHSIHNTAAIILYIATGVI